MRKTGSRDPRESLEASATSPVSIAVNTFSIRIGSRRNQRPPHQKIRSITTVSPTIDTSRIGHITGPPLWNLSINQLLPSKPPLGCAAAADGLSAAGLVAVPGLEGAAAVAAGDSPGAGLPAGAPGLVAGAAGLVAAAAPAAGDVCGAAGDCASEVTTSATEHRQVVSSVFIV